MASRPGAQGTTLPADNAHPNNILEWAMRRSRDTASEVRTRSTVLPVMDAAFDFLGYSRAEQSADGSALILIVEGDKMEDMQAQLLAYAEKSLPSTVFGTGTFRDEDAVLCSVVPHDSGPYEGVDRFNGQIDSTKFSGERMPVAAGPLVISRAEEWEKLTDADKLALQAQFNDILQDCPTQGPVPVYVKRDAVLWRKAPAAEVVGGRKGVLYLNLVLHPELTVKAIRQRRSAVLIGGCSGKRFEGDTEAQNRPTDEQEEFQRAFGAVILTRAGTKVDYVGENFRTDIVRASDSDTREQLLKDAQMRLDKVKQNITETVLWRIEVVEDDSGNHLAKTDLLKGRYRVLRKIGEGATATVYLCEDCKMPAETWQSDVVEASDTHAGTAKLAEISGTGSAVGDISRAPTQACGVLRALKRIPSMAIRQGEAEAMRMLDHPNIIKLYDSFYVGMTSFYMVLELCKGGALLDEVEQLQKKKRYNEGMCASLMRQVLQAVQYLHASGFLHRDIKPANFLADRQTCEWEEEDGYSDLLTVKLADFGWVCRDSFVFSKRTLERAKQALQLKMTTGACSSAFLASVWAFLARAEEILQDEPGEISWSVLDFEHEFLRLCPAHVAEVEEVTKAAMEWCKKNAGDGDEDAVGRAGTTAFMAPEVVEGREWQRSSVDVWSCGVMLYALLTGELPFGRPDMPGAVLEKAILEESAEREGGVAAAGSGSNLCYYEQDPLLSHCSGEVKGLLAQMLTRAPEERISAQKALKHSWIEHLAKRTPGKATIPGDMAARLREFDDAGNLTRAASYLLASHMDHAKIKGLASLFKRLDVGGHGLITLECIQQAEGIPTEVREGLQKLLARRASDASAASTHFNRSSGSTSSVWTSRESFAPVRTGLTWSHSTSGAEQGITYTEFVAAVMDHKDLLTQNWCKTVFGLFDLDGDGKITAAEVKRVLVEMPSLRKMLGDDVKLEEVLAAADTKGDGAIDFDEFRTALRVEGDPKTPVTAMGSAQRSTAAHFLSVESDSHEGSHGVQLSRSCDVDTVGGGYSAGDLSVGHSAVDRQRQGDVREVDRSHPCESTCDHDPDDPVDESVKPSCWPRSLARFFSSRKVESADTKDSVMVFTRCQSAPVGDSPPNSAWHDDSPVSDMGETGPGGFERISSAPAPVVPEPGLLRRRSGKIVPIILDESEELPTRPPA